MSIKIDISYGELLDKITILEIKSERIADEAKLENVRTELRVLQDCWDKEGIVDKEISLHKNNLKKINETLWDIEDEIRELEATKSFGDAFIRLARSVYKTNDERAAVKRKINEALGSALIEEKSYQDY